MIPLSPENFRLHVRKTAASIILKLTYGTQVAGNGIEEYVTLADRTMESLAAAGIFGTYLVVSLRHQLLEDPGSNLETLPRTTYLL